MQVCARKQGVGCINKIDNCSSPTAAWQLKLSLVTLDIVNISFKIYGAFYLRGPKYFTAPYYV